MYFSLHYKELKDDVPGIVGCHRHKLRLTLRRSWCHIQITDYHCDIDRCDDVIESTWVGESQIPRWPSAADLQSSVNPRFNIVAPEARSASNILTRATLPWDAINRRSTEHPTTNLRCTKVSADSENDFRAQDRTCKNLAYYYRSFDLYLLDTPILYCTFLILLCFVSLFKSPLAIATAALRDGHVHIFVCPFVCLSPKCAQKRYFLKKN